MTPRRAPTLGMKLACLFRLGQVRCVECGGPLTEAEIEWDHRQAKVNGGEHSAANLGPIHRRMGEHGCHLRKTRTDLRDNKHYETLAEERAADEVRRAVTRMLIGKSPPASRPTFSKGRKIQSNPRIPSTPFGKPRARKEMR